MKTYIAALIEAVETGIAELKRLCDLISDQDQEIVDAVILEMKRAIWQRSQDDMD